MGMVFLDGTGLIQMDNELELYANILQEWFEKHDKKFSLLTRLPISQSFDPFEPMWKNKSEP